MSVENRKRMYEQLKEAGKLSQDDGALEKEFGKAEAPKPTTKKAIKKEEDGS